MAERDPRPNVNAEMVLRGRPIPNEPWVMPVPGWQDYGPGYVPNTSIPDVSRPVAAEPWLVSPSAAPRQTGAASKRLAQNFSSVLDMFRSAPASAPAVAAPLPQTMSPEPWGLPGYMPAETKARNASAQSSKRGAGAMPSVSYGGIPAGGLTIDQALKFLTVTKPVSPGEQAQTALLGRAAQQRGQIEQYLGTLKPTAPNYQQEVQAADQRMRNNLLDVLGGNLFQNYLAGRTVP